MATGVSLDQVKDVLHISRDPHDHVLEVLDYYHKIFPSYSTGRSLSVDGGGGGGGWFFMVIKISQGLMK